THIGAPDAERGVVERPALDADRAGEHRALARRGAVDDLAARRPGVLGLEHQWGLEAMLAADVDDDLALPAARVGAHGVASPRERVERARAVAGRRVVAVGGDPVFRTARARQGLRARGEQHGDADDGDPGESRVAKHTVSTVAE